MAILLSNMEEPKTQKQSNSKKNALLLAQDLSYARSLAANEEKVRRRSVRYLKKYLEQRSKTCSFTEESLNVLWKGLFYSMWMSDKPLVQEECAENISQLLHCLNFNESMQFFKIGMITLQNEWFGIDQLRLDKFLMFTRRLLRQAFFVLKKSNFKKKPNEIFGNILEDTVLTVSSFVPLGLLMHFTEIYLEELAKVSDGKLQPSRTIDFLRPFVTKLAFADDTRVIQWIIKFIFTHLMKQHKLGLEYEDKYKIWSAHGFTGSINQIQKVIVPHVEPEEPDSENETTVSAPNKPLDPRAGKTDVELPQLLFNAKEISEALLLPKSDSRTSKSTRNQLSIWSDKFLQLHNGIYPLGVKRLESKNRKSNADDDTNIRKAAKRLIKFEQKLFRNENKGKKRKREILENQEGELDIQHVKKKKQRLEIETSDKLENSNKTKVQKEKLEKPGLAATAFNSYVESNFIFPKKKGILEPNKNDNTVALKNTLKKKKLKIYCPGEGIDSSFDEYNFCFKRNSGVWFVTPEFAERTESTKPHLDKQNGTQDELSNRKCVILTPSRNSEKQLKKRRTDQKKGSSALRGKSRANPRNLSYKHSTEIIIPEKLGLKPGSPKKVVINTKLNVSQDIDDHILQVISSPQIPWDSSKKPGKPLLKTPIKASPINPFYKLRRF